MATKKEAEAVSRPEDQPQAPGQGGRMTEASPNPHNERKLTEAPVKTNQRDETEAENVGHSPSTRDGRIHPSVGESVGGGVADTDSMFNEADPQAEIGPSGVKTGTRVEANRKQNRKAG